MDDPLVCINIILQSPRATATLINGCHTPHCSAEISEGVFRERRWNTDSWMRTELESTIFWRSANVFVCVKCDGG